MLSFDTYIYAIHIEIIQDLVVCMYLICSLKLNSEDSNLHF